MEYLSEIDDHHFEDDSLFAHPTHFMHSLEDKHASKETYNEKSVDKPIKNDKRSNKNSNMHQSKSQQKLTNLLKNDNISK